MRQYKAELREATGIFLGAYVQENSGDSYCSSGFIYNNSWKINWFQLIYRRHWSARLQTSVPPDAGVLLPRAAADQEDLYQEQMHSNGAIMPSTSTINKAVQATYAQFISCRRSI